jgi:hypothetical protein
MAMVFSTLMILDSDNDGIADVIEAGASDGDADGMIGTGFFNGY